MGTATNATSTATGSSRATSVKQRLSSSCTNTSNEPPADWQNPDRDRSAIVVVADDDDDGSDVVDGDVLFTV